MATYDPQNVSYNPQQGGLNLIPASDPLQAPSQSTQALEPTYDPNNGGTLQGQGPTIQLQEAGPVPNATPPPDPYAQWGGQANYQRLADSFGVQKNNISGTSSDAATTAAHALHSSILDWLDQMTTGQNGVNERGVQNELAKKQGMSSIVDMVGRGLRSGGTLLANKNALSSSAAEAIARAYGDIGRRQASGVGNQYELENRNIGLDQETLDRSKATGLRKFGETEQQSVGSIVTDARDRLAQLDASMANASMPQRIDIEREKAAIQGQVSQILSQYDPELNQGAAAITPTSTDARRATAFDLANKGVAATNPFDFSTQVPAQFQNTGPFSSDIPLFSNFKGKRAATA